MNLLRLLVIPAMLLASLVLAACQPVVVQQPPGTPEATAVTAPTGQPPAPPTTAATPAPAAEDETPPPGPTAGLERCQELVDSFKALHAGLELPDALMAENATKTGGEFDVNTYFTVLDRLSMEPGYVLDYVYYYNGMGGHPVLYAREEDAAPYATFDDFYAARGEPSADDPRSTFLGYVIADGSAESYLQLAILELLGHQFYLFWHSNYHDAQFTCDEAALERLLASPTLRTEGETLADVLTPAQLQAMRTADITPRVTMDGDRAQVRAVVFTQWGGLIEIAWTIERDFPHGMQTATQTLVEYDSGLAF